MRATKILNVRCVEAGRARRAIPGEGRRVRPISHVKRERERESPKQYDLYGDKSDSGQTERPPKCVPMWCAPLSKSGHTRAAHIL